MVASSDKLPFKSYNILEYYLKLSGIPELSVDIDQRVIYHRKAWEQKRGKGFFSGGPSL
jgi:hypothetical protein